MGSLVIVRHGQASLGSDDYDQLSPLGRRQSRLLGAHWAERGHPFDRVVVGPLRRHRQTLEEIRAGFGGEPAGLPEAMEVEALREHQAVEVIRRVLARQATGTDGPPGGGSTQAWFRHFDRIMREWIVGETRFEDLEDWQQARRRVTSVLRELAGAADRHTLAVTSGGFACMAVGDLLGLGDVEVYELALELRNAAWVEIRLPSGAPPRLAAFNVHPHLTEPELHTLV